MRPCVTPRGVTYDCFDNITEHGPSVSYDSSSATSSVPCTYRKCAGSAPFSDISCGTVCTTYDDEWKSDQPASPISSITGMSHCGGSSYGWYQASTKPLRTSVGYVRSFAFLLPRWLYGMF